MKKQVSFSTQGQSANIGALTIFRMLPNRYAEAVGPFVFLDYLAPAFRAPTEPVRKNRADPHPHRGIATLTYILNGEGEHFDSRGNHAKVHSGGAQWMKAGNGIIHEESFRIDSQTDDGLTHGFQFWINLPSKNKLEPPDYLPIQANEVPQQKLDDERGWIKVVAGQYENLVSPIPSYSRQFLYHIHLEAGKQFSLETEDGLEYAVMLPDNTKVIINDIAYEGREFIEFDRNGGTIEMVNNSSVIDVIVFGGERYTEPIVAQGPFVMNTLGEVAEAYKDFLGGKYGEITHEPK